MFKQLAAATVMLALGTLSAHAGWERNVSGVGPNGGTWSSSGSGSCANGRCSSQQSYTGPRGNTWRRSGSTTCANGVCNGTATYTAPSGRTWTRNRSFRRW